MWFDTVPNASSILHVSLIDSFSLTLFIVKRLISRAQDNWTVLVVLNHFKVLKAIFRVERVSSNLNKRH